MNQSQRCNKYHDLHPKRDFMDDKNHSHPTCNQCRQQLHIQQIERHRLRLTEQDLIDLLNDTDAMEDLYRDISMKHF